MGRNKFAVLEGIIELLAGLNKTGEQGTLAWLNMSCRASRRAISLYLDRELREPALGRFMAHTEICAACRTKLEDQRRLLSGLRAAGKPLSAPPGLRDRVARILNAIGALILAAGFNFRKPF